MSTVVVVIVVILLIVFAWPALVGLAIGASGKNAPLWWKVLTGIVAFVAQISYWIYLADEDAGFPTTSLIILGIYVLVSLLIYVLCNADIFKKRKTNPGCAKSQ